MSIPFLGDTIRIEDFDYGGYPIPSIRFSWYSDGFLIEGSTGSEHVVTPEDVGAILSVTIDIENLYGATFSELMTNVVQSEAIIPEFVDGPEIGGEYLPPIVGNLVYVSSQITGVPTPTIEYTWSADDETIKTANAPTYTPRESDEGKIISVDITATNILGSVSSSVSFEEPVRPDELMGSYANILGSVFGGYSASVVSDIYGASTITYTWQVDSGSGFETFGTNTKDVFIPEDYIGNDIRCNVSATDGNTTLFFQTNTVEVQEQVGVSLNSYAHQGILQPGDGYDADFVEFSEEQTISTADVFASESHPTLHFGLPDVHYMGASGFTLDVYTFHGSSIKNVIISCDGGTGVTAGFEQISGNTGAGYFYFPVDASEFTAGETYEIRVTSIPFNGYSRSGQMILTYYGEENKIQIDTSTSLKEACLQITESEEYDPTKQNIIELTESGYYDFGSNVSGSFPTDYGVIEVVPADGISAKFDLTTQTKNNQNITRPGIKQIKFKNITFENKIGPAAENPDNSNPGVYVNDGVENRWYFEGCTMQGDWYDSGNWLLSCEEAPNREGWFRSAYFQRLYYLNCYAEQCHNSPFGARLAKNCVCRYNHQDSYTLTKACINCSSIDHLTPTCSAFHADHYQLFSPRPPWLVENYLLYGYRGNDLVENIQPFGFFGTGNETYRNIAHIECVWDGASGSPALAQIGLSYDHIMFIGCSLENRGFAFVDRPGNAIGPVLVRGTRGPSVNCGFLHELEYLALVGGTNEFRIEDNIPEVRFTGSPTDDSVLTLLYEWHIPASSMTSVENFNSYLIDGDGTNTSWYLGVTAGGPSGPRAIADIFYSNNNTGRFAYSNFNYPENIYFRSFTLTNIPDEVSALNLEDEDYYIRMITSKGTSTSLAGKKRATNNLVGFSGFSPNVFNSVNQTADDILNSATGVTLQVLSPR